MKGQVGKDKGLGDDSTWTLEDLLDEMREKAEERFTVDKADEVKTTVTVDFEQMGDTAEYLWMNGLEKVLLYDTVTVINQNNSGSNDQQDSNQNDPVFPSAVSL